MLSHSPLAACAAQSPERFCPSSHPRSPAGLGGVLRVPRLLWKRTLQSLRLERTKLKCARLVGRSQLSSNPPLSRRDGLREPRWGLSCRDTARLRSPCVTACSGSAALTKRSWCPGPRPRPGNLALGLGLPGAPAGKGHTTGCRHLQSLWKDLSCLGTLEIAFWKQLTRFLYLGEL